jgi:hypothetical protein
MFVQGDVSGRLIPAARAVNNFPDRMAHGIEMFMGPFFNSDYMIKTGSDENDRKTVGQ